MTCVRRGLVQVSTPEARQRREHIVCGAPFLLLMHCQAKTEMHIAQFFAMPQPQRPNEASRVYRLCKVRRRMSTDGTAVDTLTV